MKRLVMNMFYAYTKPGTPEEEGTRVVGERVPGESVAAGRATSSGSAPFPSPLSTLWFE
jgi:hypothetical protein